MANKTTLEAVQEHMREMKETKALELERIRQLQRKAGTELEAAETAMRRATEEMNIEAYEEAKTQKQKVQTALDMYASRYSQIRQKEYISEEESDKVIKSLLQYEDELADTFTKSLGTHLKSLEVLYATYINEVRATEDTLRRWTNDIHANYQAEVTSKVLPDGSVTKRMDKPQPVHLVEYTGCTEAKLLGEYLRQSQSVA